MRSLALIADEPAAMRTIGLALRQAADLRVVATIDGRVGASGPLALHSPDVVVIDQMCQRANALARIREAREQLPDALLVLLSHGRDSGFLTQAFEAGVDAAISRSLPPQTLGTLLREVVRENVLHSPRRAKNALAAAHRGAHVRVVPAQDAPEARTSA